MASLETQLGVSLWDRSTKVATLTPAGQAILASARRGCTDADDLRRLADTLVGGVEPSLSLCVDLIFPLPALVELCRGFARVFPTVPLQVHSETMRAAGALVQEGSVQLGFVGPLGQLLGRPVPASPMRPLPQESTPMKIRRATERGHAQHGWLNSYHTFSFADYQDPNHMGFRTLRVINEDRVAPGQGFGRHPHRDMEIISYVLQGALSHQDSMGNRSVIRPGEAQRMSAGTGVLHSEFNASTTEPVHFLQIWLFPDRSGYPPSYEQKEFPRAERQGRFRLLASRDGRAGSLTLHQDADLHGGLFAPGEETTFVLAPGRHAWVQVARGSISLQGQDLSAGDAAAIEGPASLPIIGREAAEVLAFDLA